MNDPWSYCYKLNKSDTKESLCEMHKAAKTDIENKMPETGGMWECGSLVCAFSVWEDEKYLGIIDTECSMAVFIKYSSFYHLKWIKLLYLLHIFTFSLYKMFIVFHFTFSSHLDHRHLKRLVISSWDNKQFRITMLCNFWKFWNSICAWLEMASAT